MTSPADEPLEDDDECYCGRCEFKKKVIKKIIDSVFDLAKKNEEGIYPSELEDIFYNSFTVLLHNTGMNYDEKLDVINSMSKKCYKFLWRLENNNSLD